MSKLCINGVKLQNYRRTWFCTYIHRIVVCSGFATNYVLGILKLFSINHTLPTAEILSGKNAQAWVSMVLYLEK